MSSLINSLESLTAPREKACVSVYLILKEGSQVLLLLRKDTGYFDRFYGLVSGHVEHGESATFAMVREAYEEAGIQISPASLKVVHVMHRKSDRVNVDIFFECSAWEGTIFNKEPQKCASLEFFPYRSLPKNTINYISDALEAICSNQFYSEYGWDS